MSGGNNVGQERNLTNRLYRTLASAAIVGTLAFGAWTLADASSIAGGETRVISLVHQHTKESLTITYMQNGRYVPSAMKKLNHFLRDWRRNETVKIDPRTIDLIWELHADLSSKKPIHIVSGYRSPKTNAFLKRIGRKVAKKSQHMSGKAIDFFFPDVSTAKIRNSALARSVGGVGYYRSAGGPTGFLHADSGNVRHWGPGMSPSQISSLIRDGRKSVGKRMSRKGWADTQVASAEPANKKSGGLLSLIWSKKQKPAPETVAAAPEPEPYLTVVEQPEVATAPKRKAVTPVEAAYEDYDDEMADLSADAAAAEEADAKKTKLKLPVPSKVAAPVEQTIAAVEKPVTESVAIGEMAALANSASIEPAFAAPEVQTAERQDAKPVVHLPKPRLKPRAVMVMAAARVTLTDEFRIEPASAPPESQTAIHKPSVVADSLGDVDAANTLTNETAVADGGDSIYDDQTSNSEGKESLLADLSSASEQDPLVIKPVLASLDQAEPSWWSFLYAKTDDLALQDNQQPEFDSLKTSIMPIAAVLGPDGTGPATSLELTQRSAEEGKGDSLMVNREGKSGLPKMKLRLSSRSQEADTTSN